MVAVGTTMMETDTAVGKEAGGTHTTINYKWQWSTPSVCISASVVQAATIAMGPLP